MAIEFSCQCGNVFRLDDDEAGMEMQCARCGRLNDVPLPSDLNRISDDGTFQLDDAPVLNDPKKAAELLYVYSRHEHDIDGYQKDLRVTAEEAEQIGVGEQAHIANQKMMPHGPRYDPETGELVREIEIAPPDAKYAIGGKNSPIPTATLAYATGSTPGTISIFSVFVRLFEPGNLAVMGALLLMHLFSLPLIGLVAKGFIFLGFAIPIFMIGMIGHYGNIVDETGPSERDELPRPFRDLHFYDDLWLPFCNVCGALMLSYMPIGIPAWLGFDEILPLPVAAMIVAILAGLGSFFFPAIFLTLQTSGTPVNLRPDRVLGVIAASGPMYFVVTVLWIAAGGTYLWGTFGSAIGIAIWMNSSPLQRAIQFRLTMPMLLCGIFLAHYFCFSLGLIYRAHHADFPWAFQRHIRTTLPTVMAAPRTPRRRPAAPRPKD